MAPGEVHYPCRQEVGKAEVLMVEETTEVDTQGADRARELSLVRSEQGQTQNLEVKGGGGMTRRVGT